MLRTLFICSLAIVLGGCQISQKDRSVTLCEDVLMKYPQHRDKGPVRDYQALFTEDATFSVPKLNISLQGSDAIANRVRSALITKKSIHMITSMNITPSSKNSLTAQSHFILYLTSLEDHTQPMKVFNGRYEDQLVIKSGQCYIQRRNVLIDRVDTL
ncbi:nuclear transport factor 2 family protein [Pseudoalteromonas sp. MMG013]|uniref:nuclear transport factor 2 family protein n=1 Tax=Pseudoalteromonas sp. MMG013 TaxID=2822687 RepID=UPI001B394946|nr:nuclear transport factor 2 family protein [Pseudoalteromonas sp. MMG013]MBQ4860658.1 nuclear transport factor 2 family protein [Pseudoalteromonas sp. MMG013]